MTRPRRIQCIAFSLQFIRRVIVRPERASNPGISVISAMLRVTGFPARSHECPARVVLIMPLSPRRWLFAQFGGDAPPLWRAAQNQIEAALAEVLVVV